MQPEQKQLSNFVLRKQWRQPRVRDGCDAATNARPVLNRVHMVDIVECCVVIRESQVVPALHRKMKCVLACLNCEGILVKHRLVPVQEGTEQAGNKVPLGTICDMTPQDFNQVSAAVHFDVTKERQRETVSHA